MVDPSYPASIFEPEPGPGEPVSLDIRANHSVRRTKHDTYIQRTVIPALSEINRDCKYLLKSKNEDHP